MRLKSQGEHVGMRLHTTEQLEVLQSQAKYEMNLAEFPLAILSKRLPHDCKAIEYEDTTSGKDGAIIPRKWKVTPSAEYGFGSSQILGTLFELFQLWRESGFHGRSIPFGSIYNLIKRLGLNDSTPNYDRVRGEISMRCWGFSLRQRTPSGITDKRHTWIRPFISLSRCPHITRVQKDSNHYP